MALQQIDIAPKEASPDFELLYLAVRGLEGRIYTDEELMRLPEISPAHLHVKEWQIRKRSSEKLVNYLAKKKKPLNILEVGCGNGWLAAKLAQIKDANVFAIDVNRVEINQAKRVFKSKNLQFFGGSHDSSGFVGVKFDVIVFAASIQYFAPLADTLDQMLGYLAARGEIHILDSNFYTPLTVDNAVLRTQEYYSSMRYPEMAALYFHHRLDELAGFDHQILSNPHSLKNRLLKGSPFYWIQINNTDA
nr:class I SAM-dependent methyltransferase [uncultured Mucilaginibacter sp.]